MKFGDDPLLKKSLKEVFVSGAVTCRIPETHFESIQTSKMELFAVIVHGFQPLTIFARSFILDVWLGSEYASGFYIST